VSGQCHAPANSPQGKSPSTHCTGAAWATGLVWMGAEILAPTGIAPQENGENYD